VETYLVDEQSLVDEFLPETWGATFPAGLMALAPAYVHSRALVASSDRAVLAYRHTADGPVGAMVSWATRGCQLGTMRGLQYLDGVVLAPEEKPEFHDTPDGPVQNSGRMMGIRASDMGGTNRDVRPLAVIVDTELRVAFDVVRGGQFPLVVEDPAFRADVPRVLLLLPACGDGGTAACVYAGTPAATRRRLRSDPRAPEPIMGWGGCPRQLRSKCLQRPPD
jgi:hypothetical protein